MTLVTVCKVDEVKDNSLRLFNVNSVEIVVGKRKGKFFACVAHCPHKGSYLHKGWFNGDNLVCPLHNYEFNVSTGKLEKMTSWKEEHPTWIEQDPEWRKSGDLILYDVKVRNGYVLVDLP